MHLILLVRLQLLSNHGPVEARKAEHCFSTPSYNAAVPLHGGD